MDHVFLRANRVNTVSLAVSRLSMDRTSQNDGTNDIVSALGIQGIGFGARTPGVLHGSPFRLHGNRRYLRGHAEHAWDTTIEVRDTYAWQRGRHAMKFGGEFHRYIWPMWGFSRTAAFYQYTTGYTTEFGFNDGSGSGLASMLLSLPAVSNARPAYRKMDLRAWGRRRSRKIAGR